VPVIPNIDPIQTPPRQQRELASLRLSCLLLLVALAAFTPGPSRAQTAETSAATSAAAQSAPAGKQPPESELIVEGQGSFGNYKIFAAGEGSRLFTGGVEYERHSWGHFLGAQVYYAGEFLPVVVLDEPTRLDYYGNPHSATKHLVPGVGIIPIGFRLLWLHDRAVEPYMMAKGGIFGFTQKVLSPAASYEDFILHSEVGVQIRMTDKTDLRLGAGDFHFSNAFIVPSNPGLDVMSYDAGICYRFQRTQH
jgi:Lipid A 3-O-deacylase (PagL)